MNKLDVLATLRGEAEVAVEPKMGIRCGILRANGERSTRGLSTLYNNVILVGKDIPEEWEPSEDCPAVVLDRIVFNSIDVTFARPIGDDGKHCSFGGNYIVGSVRDGFPFDHPMKLHDRRELPGGVTDADRLGILAYRGDELILYFPGDSKPTVDSVLANIQDRLGRRGADFLYPVDLSLWQDKRLVGYVIGDISDIRSDIKPVFVKI